MTCVAEITYTLELPSIYRLNVNIQIHFMIIFFHNSESTEG